MDLAQLEIDRHDGVWARPQWVTWCRAHLDSGHRQSMLGARAPRRAEAAIVRCQACNSAALSAITGNGFALSLVQEHALAAVHTPAPRDSVLGPDLSMPRPIGANKFCFLRVSLRMNCQNQG
jgi:hypothetical protein